MNEWRSENWLNPYEELIKKEKGIWWEELECYGHPDVIEDLEGSASIYEAGANAMLFELIRLLQEWDHGVDVGRPYKFWHRTFILPESVWKKLTQFEEPS